MSVRVRFAPSPTGSLHLGNALVAAANRAYADAHGGVLVLRIDDTDATRVVAGGEAAILADLRWLGIGWDDGPVRQSERSALYAEASARALAHGAVRDEDGSVRLGHITLLRPDGTATYQLASVVDDLALGITHVIRGADHRANEPVHRAIATAIGGTFPDVVHVGLLLGEDGRKLSKRDGPVSVADLRAEGVPGSAVRAYLDELGLPIHDVRLDRSRIARLATEVIAAMSDDDLAIAADAPVDVVPALRGARTLVEAAASARLVLERPAIAADPEARPTLERFVELRAGAPDRLDGAEAKAILRELKAVGGDLRVLRRALTGAERGPELWSVLAALPLPETIARAVHAGGL